MFVILLRFSANKAQAPHFMDGHNAWLKRGFEDGVFMLSGSLQPGLGGAILAHNTSLGELQARMDEDPFVAGNVVDFEILDIAPGQTNERLAFLRPDR